MADFILYGFGESGNVGGETRSEAYRKSVNSLGEVPVLLHEDKKLIQSGVDPRLSRGLCRPVRAPKPR